MFTLPEQFSAATKASFDAQLAMLSAFTSKTMESVEKIVELNMTAAKTSLEESNAVAKQLISAKDPQEFINLAAANVQPSAEKSLAYARHCASIFSTNFADQTKTAEILAAEAGRKASAFADELFKHAPAGSENYVGAVKSVIGNASALYDQSAKIAKQAVETLEANITTATNNMTQAAAKVAPRTTKK